MAYRDQPLGELALSIPAHRRCFASTIWITAAAENRRWRVPPRVTTSILTLLKRNWRNWLNSPSKRLARRSAGGHY